MAESLDLNSARLRDIASLPGVDQWLARRIVFDRRVHGPFHSVRDLARVEGVTPSLLAILSDRAGVVAPAEGYPAVSLSFTRISERDGKEAALPFVGPPSALRGSFLLRNLGAMVVRAPRFLVENTKLRRSSGVALTHVVADVWVPPGEERRVALTVRIDPTTAPGIYPAEFVIGDSRQPVIFIVTGHVATLLSPCRLLLTSHNRVSEHRVLVRNDGNLPLKIDDIGALVLEDAELQCRVIRETVRRTNHPTLDKLVGTAADELKKQFGDIKPLEVRTRNKPVRISSGGEALLILKVEIPKKLPRRRNFTATAYIGDAPLEFELSWSLRR